MPRSNAKGSQTVGSPFLCLLSFGEAKESKSPAGARPGPGNQTYLAPCKPAAVVATALRAYRCANTAQTINCI
ncbi:hypothetical protein D3H34_17860 [Acidovorax cavernicola]|uniref:Uncharacterized protein n=1 Tax=Acidovorax cavernicola TaxID=1675792 RepID=A0A9X8D3A9_9BURK|nr:hypothetical protein D3H34_17860 [Acidovorax cavernicola]